MSQMTCNTLITLIKEGRTVPAILKKLAKNKTETRDGFFS